MSIRNKEQRKDKLYSAMPVNSYPSKEDQHRTTCLADLTEAARLHRPLH